MKVYEVEYRAVITLAAQDMQKAASQGAAAIKYHPHLFHLRAIHERNFRPDSGQADEERVAHSLRENLL
jgi:hypothetical protein